MHADEILAGLTPEQAEAVRAPSGPIAVIAGPGTGKTRVLSARIAHRILACGDAPESIVGVTFTTRAGEELRTRTAQLLGDRPLPFMGTFHAFGLTLLRELGAPSRRIGTPPQLEALAARLWPAPESNRAGRILGAIQRAKEEGLAPRDVADPELAASYAAYEEAMRAEGLLDLPDCILRPVQLLAGDPSARARLQQRRPHLLVDEFQDVNPLQLRLLELLGGAGGGLFVIGDPNQAIYAFRGACTFALDRLRAIWPNLAVHTLGVNWRSTRAIVEASVPVLPPAGRATAAALRAAHEAGPRPVLARHGTPKAELTWVLRTIEQLIGGTSHYAIDSGWADGNADENMSFGDIAVLYRTNAQGDVAQAAFDEAGLPYRRVRPKAPAADEEVVEALQRARSAVGPEAPAAALAAALGSDDARQPVKDLAARAARFVGSVEAFVRDLAFLRPEDTYLPGAHVHLMTFHAAKGLEFPAVFLIGMADGLVPFVAASTPEELDEERRLVYVGCTRAVRRLFLSYPTHGRAGAASARGGPSPFIGDIPAGCLEAPPRAAAKPKKSWRQLDLFS